MVPRLDRDLAVNAECLTGKAIGEIESGMVSTLCNDQVFIFTILQCNGVLFLEEKQAIGYSKDTGYVKKATVKATFAEKGASKSRLQSS